MVYHINQNRKAEECLTGGHDVVTHFACKEAAEEHAVKLQRKYEAQVSNALQVAARCGRELESLVARSGDYIDSYLATSAGLRAQWWRNPMQDHGVWGAEEEGLLNHLLEQLRCKHAAHLAQKYGLTELAADVRDEIYTKASRCGLADSAKAERKYRKLAQAALSLQN